MNIIRLNSIGEPFAKSEQATPPSGGGTEGGMKYEYLDLSGIDLSLGDNLGYVNAIVVSSLINIKNTTLAGKTIEGVITYGMLSFFEGEASSILAVAVDPEITIADIFGGTGNTITLREYLESVQMYDKYMALPRLTKEQFYAL